MEGREGEIDLENAQEITANWMGTATTEDKIGFMKILSSTLTTKEIDSLLACLNHEKRRKKRKDPSLRKPKKSSEEEVSEPAQAVSEPAQAVSEPVQAVSVPTEFDDGEDDFEIVEEKVGWWADWPKDKIVAMDCEHVQYNKKSGFRGLEKTKAATVSIVNWNSEVIYEESVRHNPLDCDINGATIAINGITRAMIKRGKQLDEVRERVREILADKLVIVCSGETDFRSLGLEMGSFETFDLHSHWLMEKINDKGVVVVEKIGLKRMAKKHLGIDFQRGCHSATEDAKVTMRIFKEVYPHEKKSDFMEKWNSDFYTDFDSSDSLFCITKK